MRFLDHNGFQNTCKMVIYQNNEHILKKSGWQRQVKKRQTSAKSGRVNMYVEHIYKSVKGEIKIGIHMTHKCTQPGQQHTVFVCMIITYPVQLHQYLNPISVGSLHDSFISYIKSIIIKLLQNEKGAYKKHLVSVSLTCSFSNYSIANTILRMLQSL